MVSEIFESLFWVGPGFIPKSRLVESFSINRDNLTEEKEVKETENHSIKSENHRYETFVRLKKQGEKIETCK